MKKLDCAQSIDYLKARAMMTKLDENGYCQIHCHECPLRNQTVTDHCETFEYLHPEKAVKLMQDYADTLVPDDAVVKND